MEAPKENPLALGFVWLLSAFLLLSTVGYLFVSLYNHISNVGAHADSVPMKASVPAGLTEDKKTEARLKPVGDVVATNTPAPAAPAAPAPAAEPAATAEPAAATGPRTGEEIVAKVCSNCHSPTMSPIMKSPQMHDGDAWAARMLKGFDAVLENAKNGINAMPPRGGDPSLTDEELASAIEFMSTPEGTTAE